MFISRGCCLTSAFFTNELERASPSSSEPCMLPCCFPNTDQNYCMLNFPLLECICCKILFVVMFLFKKKKIRNPKTPRKPNSNQIKFKNKHTNKHTTKNINFSLMFYLYQLQSFPDVFKFSCKASKLHDAPFVFLHLYLP